MSTRSVSRRDAAAGGIAMLVLAAAAAGQAKAEELDRELISAATEYHAMRAEYLTRLKPLHSGEDENARAAWAYCETVHWPREEELIGIVIETKARTPEGIRAKASVLEALLHRDVPQFIGETFDDRANDHEAMAMSLARDILGRAGA